MSKMKDYMHGIICELAEETGYDEMFLIEKWNTCMEEGGLFEDFVAITKERDW